MRTLVIVNPVGGHGRAGRHWPELRAALDRVLDRWDNQFTLGPKDATRIAAQAVEEGYEMIVAVGGDGTMNEIVDGLVSVGPDGAPRLRRPGMIVSPVRLGTGGDFARLLGLAAHLPEAVAHLAGESASAVDLGFLSFVGTDGAPMHRAFLNIASFGLSGVVDDKVNKSSKALGGRMSFLLGLSRSLLSYRPQPVRITVDEAPFYEGPMVTAACANGQFFGGGMHFAPEARIDDGLFDVVVQTRSGLREVSSIADLYQGRILSWPSVVHTRGKVVEAAPLSHEPVLLDVDGEQPGRLPARFTLLPGALRLKR